MLKSIEKKFELLVNLVSLASYAGIVLTMFLIVADVILRFCFGQPILGSYEMVERIEMCTVFASFTYATTQHAHIHVSMLIMHFPPALRLFLYGVTELSSAVMAFFVAWAGVRQALMAARSAYTTGVLFIPLAPFYWFEAVCMALFGIALLFESLKGFVGIFDREVGREIEGSWN